MTWAKFAGTFIAGFATASFVWILTLAAVMRREQVQRRAARHAYERGMILARRTTGQDGRR